MGFVDVGVRDDPTAEIVYDRYELAPGAARLHRAGDGHQRGPLHLPLALGRRRPRQLMFPGRADRIDAGIEPDVLPQRPAGRRWEFGPSRQVDSGRLLTSQTWSSSSIDNEDAHRARICLIECQFKIAGQGQDGGRRPVPRRSSTRVTAACAAGGRERQHHHRQRCRCACTAPCSPDRPARHRPEHLPAQPVQPHADLVLPPQLRRHALRDDPPRARRAAGT